jgi:transposase
MRELKFSAEVVREWDPERFEHPHPEVRRYLNAFREGGLERLGERRWKGPERRLQPPAATLEAELKKHPPRTVAEARARLEMLTGVHVQPTPVRAFLHTLGLKWRRIAAIPVPPKQTVEEPVALQRQFLDEKLQPLLAQAQAGHTHVFFVDAAHVVLGRFRCCLCSSCRGGVRASSGRQRFNVRGAWNAVTHPWVSVCHTTVVNQQTVCELLRKIAALGLVKPITGMLDNAGYPHCALCIERAKPLGIELLFLPSYSPPLNLIERIWKFVKKEYLYGRHFPSFTDFRSRNEDCLRKLGSTHQSKLGSLMTLNFQTFANRTMLAA